MNADLFSFLQFGEESFKKFDLNVKDKRELISLINESIYHKCAKTAKEKSEVLDLRDKVLKLIRYEINTQSSSSSINSTDLDKIRSTLLIGACPDMCPEKERYSRDYLNLSNVFEICSNEIDYSIMVKEYTRSSADQDLPLPNELRPLSVLFETMLFLINEIISKIETSAYMLEENSDFSICAWYDFVWNRTRSIRKDIIQQRLLLTDFVNIENQNGENVIGGVIIIEQCARFHILCSHRLCDQTSEVFDFKINEENLKNCFQSLRQYYELTSALALNGLSYLKPSPNESEFRAYLILLNLNESNILSEIQRWPKSIRHSTHVRFALKVYFAYNSKNFIQFFRLIKSSECEYLQACILHRYFYRMRYLAFKAIFSSFRDLSLGNREKIYPLNKLQDLLGFDGFEQLEDYCSMFGLDIVEDNYVIMRLNAQCFDLSKANEDALRLKKSITLVESKFNEKLNLDTSVYDLTNEKCLSMIISGENRDYVQSIFSSGHELQSSFNQEGFYISDEIEQFLLQAKQIFSTQIQPNIVPVSQKIKKIVPETTERPKFTLKPSAVANNQFTLPGQKPIKQHASSISNFTDLTSNKPNPFSSILSKQKPTTTIPAAAQASIPSLVTGGFSAPSTSKSIFPSGPSNFPVGFTSSSALSTTSSSSSLFQRAQQQTQNPLENKPNFSSVFHQGSNRNQSPLVDQKQLDQPLDDKQKPNTRYQEKLESHSENIFQSIYLELVQDLANEFLFKQNQIANEQIKDLIEKTIYIELREISEQAIAQYRHEIEQHNRNLKKTQQIEQFNYEIYENLLERVLREFFTEFVQKQRFAEKFIYDEIIGTVFQHEFEIILKQMANELNNEALLDKLAENVYFKSIEYFSVNNDLGAYHQFYDQQQSESSCLDMILNNQNSIFTNDLHSYLLECVYEFTRLNLNVNRELYYEIKELLDFNRSIYLFRKWRLKLSIKLLTKAYKTASASSASASAGSGSNNSSNSTSPVIKNRVASYELNCFSLLNSYGNHLLSNLSKFHELESILLPKVSDNNFKDLSKDKRLSRLSSKSFNFFIHCSQFLEHISRHLCLGTKYYLFNLLYENYFNIVHNRHSNVVLPLPNEITQETDNSTKSEINIKTIFAYPNLTSPDAATSKSHQIVKWLLKKIFDFEMTETANYHDLKRIERFSLNSLDENKFGINYVLKLCKTLMSRDEYETKRENRSLFGANSILFLLLPLKINENFNSYLKENRELFHTTVRLFLNPNQIQVMFVSFLNRVEITESAIEFILNDNSNKFRSCFCQLNEDCINNNAILSQTYQNFFYSVCFDQQFSRQTQPKYNNQSINHISTLSNVFYSSVMKFFESNRANVAIYIPFDCLIREYNVRLQKLIELLTNPEYRSIAWPIPELVDDLFTISDENKWTLKYWNTEECFESVLKQQFYEIMSLDECYEEDNNDRETLDLNRKNELVEFNWIERHIFNYLTNFFNKSRSHQKIDYNKSVYQLESSVKIALESMKQFCISKTDLFNRNKNDSELFIYRQNINWSLLVIPIVNYLILNATLSFKHKKDLCIDQFYIYYNRGKISSFDWVNNCEKSAKSSYLADTYSKTVDLVKRVNKMSSMKRRFSSHEQSSPNESPSKIDDEEKKCKKLNVLQQPNAQNQLENKFKQFINLLNCEKESNNILKHRLDTLATDQPPNAAPLTDCTVSNVENLNESLNFEIFFKKLKEEKMKNEKFNEKLSKLV